MKRNLLLNQIPLLRKIKIEREEKVPVAQAVFQVNVQVTARALTVEKDTEGIENIWEYIDEAKIEEIKEIVEITKINPEEVIVTKDVKEESIEGIVSNTNFDLNFRYI